MKYFLLFFLVLPTMALGSIAWEVPEFTASYTRPAGSTSTSSIVWEVTGGTGTVSGSSSPHGNGGPGAGSASYVVPRKTASSSDTATSVRLVIVVYISGEYIPVFWQQARKVGDDDEPHGGPYLDGNPVTPEGNPVNETGEPVTPPPQRYHAKATYTNPHPYSVQVREYWFDNTLNLSIRDFMGSCDPGETYISEGWNNNPFTITLTTFRDGTSTGEDPVTVEAEPVDEENPPEGTPPLTGTNGGGSTGAVGGGSSPGTQMQEPDAVTDQPRTGDANGDAEARHQELRGEIQRAVSQLVANGNQAKSDASTTNDLLNGIKNNTAGSSGEGGDGGEGGGPLTSPGSDSVEDGASSDDGGIATKLESMKTGSAAVLESLQALVDRLGLTTVSVGNQTLIWSISLPIFGTIELNVEAVVGEWVPLIRGFLLFLLGWKFVLETIYTVKEIFV